MSRELFGARRAAFQLLINTTQELAMWPVEFDVPGGWSTTGFAGDLTGCAAFSRTVARRLPTAQATGTGELSDTVDAAVERWAERLVLHTGAASYTYRQLGRACRGLVEELRRNGVAPEEAVGVRARSGFGWLTALTGLTIHGALPVAAGTPTRVAVREEGGEVVVRAVGGPGRDERARTVGPGPRTVGLVDDDAAAGALVTVSDAGLAAMLSTTAARSIRHDDRTAWVSPSSSWRHLFEAWSTLNAGACLVRSAASPPDPTVVVMAPGDARVPVSARLVVVDGALDTDHRGQLHRRGVDVVETCSAAGLGGIAAERTRPGRWNPVFPRSTYVLDTDLTTVAPGRAGELYVGGAAIGRGVPDRADLTLLRWLPDPFAGDGSRMLATGHRAVPSLVDGHRTTALESIDTPQG